MSNMARTTSGGNSPHKGFSILQPTIGAPLSWMPAVGTKELDQLINAYLPGPASTQEKRATISIDFFEYSAQTGESFKYYPVNSAATLAGTSPAASSSFASPAISDLTYSGSSPSQVSTPAANMARGGSRRSRGDTSPDASQLPGMKILTIDGQDVTNSVSRGCKTKEQREHAHLMRVLKACDACKKKKIRCDPSHKKRTGSQAKSEATPKPAAKKARKSAPPPASQATSFTPATEVALDFDMATFESFPTVDQSWDEFLTFNDEALSTTAPQDFYGAIPQEFDFFFGQEPHFKESQFSPAISGSSGSSDSPAQPLTPDNSQVVPQFDFTAFADDSTLAFVQANGHEPVLPYMASAGAHGSNYVDFNLYSPASSFIDEEPQKLKAGNKRKASDAQTENTASRSSSSSPSSLDEPLVGTGLTRGQQWRFDHSGSASPLVVGVESRVPTVNGDAIFEDLYGPSSALGSQLPFHAGNDGHGASAAVVLTRSNNRPLQVIGAATTIAPAVLLETSSSNVVLSQRGSSGSAASSAPLASRSPSPLGAVQQDRVPVVGNAQAPQQTVSPFVSNLHE